MTTNHTSSNGTGAGGKTGKNGGVKSGARLATTNHAESGRGVSHLAPGRGPAPTLGRVAKPHGTSERLNFNTPHAQPIGRARFLQPRAIDVHLSRDATLTRRR